LKPSNIRAKSAREYACFQVDESFSLDWSDLNSSKPAEQPGILETSYGFYTRLSEVTDKLLQVHRTAQHYSKERGVDAMENYSHKIRNAEEPEQDRTRTVRQGGFSRAHK
jgi:hypothetical protein